MAPPRSVSDSLSFSFAPQRNKRLANADCQNAKRKNKPYPTTNISEIDETPASTEEDIIEQDTAEQNTRNLQTGQMDIMLEEMGLPPNMFDLEARTNGPNMLLQVISSAGDTT